MTVCLSGETKLVILAVIQGVTVLDGDIVPEQLPVCMTTSRDKLSFLGIFLIKHVNLLLSFNGVQCSMVYCHD